MHIPNSRIGLIKNELLYFVSKEEKFHLQLEFMNWIIREQWSSTVYSKLRFSGRIVILDLD